MKRLVVLVGTSAALVVLAASFLGGLRCWIDPPVCWPSEEFSREKWREDRDRRYALYRDLEASGQLASAKKHDVVELLGEPDSPNYPNATWFYRITRAGPGTTTFYLLQVEFEDDKVRSYFVRPD